jgi:long-chain acyl-CoA synthetase
MRLLTDLLTSNLDANADRAALLHGDRVVTHRELASTVARVADALDELHGLPGNRVALLLPNCPEFVAAYLGIAASGNVAVPVNTHHQPGEIAHVLNDCQASCLIVSEALLPRVAAARDRLPALRTVIVVGDNAALPSALKWDEVLAGRPDAYSPLRQAAPEDVVVFLYTSGSTGRPKAAMLTHANLLSNVETEAALYGLTGADVFSGVLPLFHNYALVDCCLLPFRLGAAVALGEPQNGDELLALIERHRVSFLAALPAALAEMALRTPARTYDTRSLRMVQTGGAPLPAEVYRRFEDLYGLPILEGYGCSEAASTVTVMPPDEPVRPGSVGRVMPNQQIRLVDEEGNEVPAGADGEVLVRGPNVFRGYSGQPALTRAALAGGWLHTGDLGRLDADGYLYITGRKKAMINVGGLKVSPAEVEEVLYEIAGVTEACVVAGRGPDGGEVVKAFLAAAPGRRPDPGQVRRHCAARLAGYKVPGLIELRDALPRTGSGKIAARQLQEEEWNRPTTAA